MTAELFLRQIKDKQDEIDRERKRLDKVDRYLTLTTSNFSLTPPSSSHANGNEIKLLKDQEKRETLYQKQRELFALKDEVQDVVDRVPKRVYKRLLTLRYIQLLPWQVVADTMDYSIENIQSYMRCKAMKELQKVLDI